MPIYELAYSIIAGIGTKELEEILSGNWKTNKRSERIRHTTCRDE
jgi:hypothetical protein